MAAAQTNLSLYEKLDALGYSPEALRYVRDCYELATTHVAGRFRPSGKTFIAHLIGTASILAEIEAPLPVVSAGLLHGVYRHGDFGLVSRKRKRARVRAVAGDAVEKLVWGYTWATWSDRSIEALAERPDLPPEPERTYLLMRLANDLEEYLDRGRFVCGAPPDPETLRRLASISERMGQPRLAAGFAAFAREGGPFWTEVLHTPRAEYYWLALPSSRLLLPPARRLRRWARRAASLFSAATG
jgi:hypothetical protein